MMIGLVAIDALIAFALALMTPLLTMAPPWNVTQLQMKMPVWPPVIVPEFDTLPKNEVAPTTMPAPLAPTEISPELVMPFRKVVRPSVSMPTELLRVVMITPELLMPPAKVEIVADPPPALLAITAMPVCLAVIVPELLMPPPKLEIVNVLPGPNAAPPTKMPVPAVILPLLVIPPENAEIVTDPASAEVTRPPTKTPAFAAEIVPELLMPLRKVEIVTEELSALAV